MIEITIMHVSGVVEHFEVAVVDSDTNRPVCRPLWALSRDAAHVLAGRLLERYPDADSEITYGFGVWPEDDSEERELNELLNYSVWSYVGLDWWSPRDFFIKKLTEHQRQYNDQREGRRQLERDIEARRNALLAQFDSSGAA